MKRQLSAIRATILFIPLSLQDNRWVASIPDALFQGLKERSVGMVAYTFGKEGEEVPSIIHRCVKACVSQAGAQDLDRVICFVSEEEYRKIEAFYAPKEKGPDFVARTGAGWYQLPVPIGIQPTGDAPLYQLHRTMELTPLVNVA